MKVTLSDKIGAFGKELISVRNSASAVRAKLRNSLIKLEKDLKAEPFDFFSEIGYRRLSAILDRNMPGIYADYEEFVRLKIYPVRQKVKCFRGCHNCCET